MSASLHIETNGPDTTPVLLLQHGFAGSARNWRPQMRALREHGRVVAFDARGHARTARRFSPAGYALSDFVRDFSDVADAVSPRAAVVAGGLSLGAAVALHFAFASPDRVAGLVLAALPPGTGHGFSRSALAFADALDREGLEAAGARFVWGAGSGLDEQAAGLVRQGFLEHSPKALAAILRETLWTLPAVSDLVPRLEALDKPALVVVGGADAGSLESCRALARALPRARLVEIPDAGHVVNLAAPDAFNASLMQFLSEFRSQTLG